MSKNNGRRLFSLSFPTKEAEEVVKAAEERGVTITMLFRMLVRKEIMQDPITLKEQ